MFTVDFDFSDLRRALDRAQVEIDVGAELAVRHAAEEGLAYSRARRRYKDHTGNLTYQAYARMRSTTLRRPESEIVWPTEYASYIDQGTPPHLITPKNYHWGESGPRVPTNSRGKRSPSAPGVGRGQALRWVEGGLEHFARVVHHPGTPAYGFAGDAYLRAERVLFRDCERGVANAQKVLQ